MSSDNWKQSETLFTGRQRGEQWHLPCLIPISLCHTHSSLCLASVHASDERSPKTIENWLQATQSFCCYCFKVRILHNTFIQKAKPPVLALERLSLRKVLIWELHFCSHYSPGTRSLLGLARSSACFCRNIKPWCVLESQIPRDPHR